MRPAWIIFGVVEKVCAFQRSDGDCPVFSVRNRFSAAADEHRGELGLDLGPLEGRARPASGRREPDMAASWQRRHSENALGRVPPGADEPAHALGNRRKWDHQMQIKPSGGADGWVFCAPGTFLERTPGNRSRLGVSWRRRRPGTPPGPACAPPTRKRSWKVGSDNRCGRSASRPAPRRLPLIHRASLAPSIPRC